MTKGFEELEVYRLSERLADEIWRSARTSRRAADAALIKTTDGS
jgi:hypothetical protein